MLRVGPQAMLWKGQRVESSICIVFQAYYLFFENLMNIDINKRDSPLKTGNRR